MQLIKEAKRWQKLAGIITEADEITPEETPEQAPTPATPAGAITKDQAARLIRDTRGKFFTVTFIKKDGTPRVLNGRLGVKAHLRGGELLYDPNAKGLIPVWDPIAQRTTGNGYRMISINTITALKIGANTYQVK